MKYIAIALITIALAACEGITASYQGKTIDAEYSAKGGLVVYPKAPRAITIIDPAK